MDRSEYQALSVDAAVRCVLEVVDHPGFEHGLAALKEAVDGRHDFDWVREDIQRQRYGSMLERVHAAGPEAVGVVVRELALAHPDGEAVLAELAQHRDERVGELIDRLLADLEDLPAPSETPPAPATLSLVEPQRLAPAAPPAERGNGAWLRRLFRFKA